MYTMSLNYDEYGDLFETAAAIEMGDGVDAGLMFDEPGSAVGRYVSS